VGSVEPGRTGEGHGRAGRGPASSGRRGGDRRGRARMAAHPHGRPVRDRHRGPHPQKEGTAGVTAGHGRGQEREGVRPMAGGASAIVPGQREGGRDGRVLWIQEGRRAPGAPRRGDP